MKISRFQSSNNPPENQYEKDLEYSLDKIFTAIGEILNGGLNFQDNFSCYKTTVITHATPGNTTVLTHGLKRTPVGCLVVEKDKAAHIYTSAKSATTYTIKSDVSSVTITIIIF